MCSCADCYQAQNMGYRGMAGNPVNPLSKGRELLEGVGGKDLQRSPSQGWVSPRRMA
jgi:hypothetical protein